MKVNRHLLRLGQATMLVVMFAVTGVWSQTATHFCNGYVSPGTITVTNTFVYPTGSSLYQFIWYPQVPSGWTVTNARGDGGPYLDPSGYIALTSFYLPNPVVIMYDVSVPAGVSGSKSIAADVYYDIGPALVKIKATPDPLVLNLATKTLQVVSAYGTATPSVGIHTNAVGTLLNPSVTASVYAGTTQYVCTGWAMSGNAPFSGSTNAFAMTVADNAVLTWNWISFNVAPVITNAVTMIGVRGGLSTMPEADLLASAFDPDGDTLTLTAVGTTGSMGGTVTWASGMIGYTPPRSPSRGFADTFTYTVADEHGAAVTGTVTVNVPPEGLLIRMF